jgi:hypothetical protein
MTEEIALNHVPPGARKCVEIPVFSTVLYVHSECWRGFDHDGLFGKLHETVTIAGRLDRSVNGDSE